MEKEKVHVRRLLADFSPGSVDFVVSLLRTNLQENVAEQQEVRRKTEEELEAQRLLDMEEAAKEEVVEAVAVEQQPLRSSCGGWVHGELPGHLGPDFRIYVPTQKF